jgi:Fic family protein
VEITEELLAKLDGLYIPFPNVEEWGKLSIDSARWDRNAAQLDQLRQNDSESLNHATELALRVAAVDTGALEGLYETNIGLTLSIATQGFAIEFEGRNVVKDFFDAQLKGYQLTLNAVTGETPISEKWIRELHITLTESQDEYEVETPAGRQKHKLPKGEYKKWPNHVIDPKTRAPRFSYAPVILVNSEMERLLKNLRSKLFADLNPIVQAAYAHYAFVRIHPFADGNGRVARVLASLYLTKAYSIPLVILQEQRIFYIDSLEKADKGNFQRFVDFIFDRAVGTIGIIADFASQSAYKDTVDSLEKINKLYVAPSGFDHRKLDELAQRLLEKAEIFLKAEVSKQLRAPISVTVDKGQEKYKEIDVPPGFRVPIGGFGTLLFINARTNPPVKAHAVLVFRTYAPPPDSVEAEVILTDHDGMHKIKCNVDDIESPTRTETSPELEIRMKAWAMGVVRHIGEILAETAKPFSGKN